MSGSPTEFSRSDSPRAKISFPLEQGGEFENMYGIYSGDGCYILDNSPFYAYGISAGDLISVQEIGGRLLFKAIEKRGGHSTYRVKLPEGASHEYFMRYWSSLGALGCSFEGSSTGSRRRYSIDMPTNVDVNAAYNILEDFEQSGIWEFEEANFYKSGN